MRGEQMRESRAYPAVLLHVHDDARSSFSGGLLLQTQSSIIGDKVGHQMILCPAEDPFPGRLHASHWLIPTHHARQLGVPEAGR